MDNNTSRDIQRIYENTKAELSQTNKELSHVRDFSSLLSFKCCELKRLLLKYTLSINIDEYTNDNPIRNEIKTIINSLSADYSDFIQFSSKSGNLNFLYKYAHLLRKYFSVLACVQCFVSFTEKKSLLFFDECRDKLFGGRKEFYDLLDVETYLFGLCLMSKQLVRLCVNSASKIQNYGASREVSEFLRDIYGGFLCLDLRNDELRRKFDGMKYDVNRTEEIVCDLKLRE